MRENILNKVLQILNANLETTENIHEQMEDELSVIGLDSITFIRIIVALEEAFDIEIPDEYLLPAEMNNISKIADVIYTVLDHQNSTIGE